MKGKDICQKAETVFVLFPLDVQLSAVELVNVVVHLTLLWAISHPMSAMYTCSGEEFSELHWHYLHWHQWQLVKVKIQQIRRNESSSRCSFPQISYQSHTAYRNKPVVVGNSLWKVIISRHKSLGDLGSGLLIRSIVPKCLPIAAISLNINITHSHLHWWWDHQQWS